MRDSYERFFSEGHISKEQFFEFGLKETIYSPYDKAEREWKNLKERIQHNQEVPMRGFGRNGNGTHLFFELYKRLLGNDNITLDKTNNAAPTQLIKELTGYSKARTNKYELIQNYQISHVFGRTKNVYAFSAPWNIVYTPKLLDPFTGHEAKGEMIDEYTKLFQKQGYEQFSVLIEDFNEIITNPKFSAKLDNCLTDLESDQSYDIKDITKLKKAVLEEFAPIRIVS